MDAKIDKGNEYNNDQKYENRGNNIRNSPAANILSDTLALPGQIPDSNEDVDSKSGDRTGDTSSEDGDGDLNDSRRLSVSDMEYDCFRKKKTKEAATQEANAGTDLNENVIPHQATSVPGEKKHQEKEKVGGTGEGDEEEELTQEQLILLDMKNKPLDIKEGEKVLTVFAGTWNLHAKPPPNDLSLWLPKDKFDIVVIGTEECEKSIQASIVFSGKEKWTNTLTQHLGPSYLEITQSTLAATHIIAFCKQEVWPKISQIDQDDVATGIGDVIGNKGGVGLCFDVGQTSFLFINAHFHAHQGNVHQRNDDYKKINGKLRLRDKDLDELHSRHELEGVKQMGQGRGKLRNIVERFDRVVWMGDLNYRVNGNRKIIDALIGQEMFEVLRANDQLLHVMRDNQAFHGFQEGPLVFPPTYKFDAGTDTYDTSKKQRIPSWTDRVVYLPRREIQLREYDSVREIRTSDHRPVYASFDMCYLPVDSLGLKDKQSSRDGTSVCSIQ